jgi:hypothetical protein
MSFVKEREIVGLNFFLNFFRKASICAVYMAQPVGEILLFNVFSGVQIPFQRTQARGQIEEQPVGTKGAEFFHHLSITFEPQGGAIYVSSL